jgi:endonuclease YncB( thermonuclease family)
VIDGDTYTIMYDGEETSVRIWGIDAPELREPGGPEARDVLASHIGGRIVTLAFPGRSKRDNFGRLLASVPLLPLSRCDSPV